MVVNLACAVWLLLYAAHLKRMVGLGHPVTIFAAAWGVLILVGALNPLGARPIDPWVSVLLFIGVVAFTLPLHFPPSRRRPVASVVVKRNRLLISAMLTTAMVAISVVAFRARTSAYFGTDFANLDPREVRVATTVGPLRGGGLVGLLGSLAPLAACLGLAGWFGFRRFYWLAFPVVALLLAMTSPARSGSLTVVVAAGVFTLYEMHSTRRTGLGESPPLRTRRSTQSRLTLALIVAAVLGLGTSVFVGLERDDPPVSGKGESAWPLPEALVSPSRYVLGGMSAFSHAIATGLDPVAGRHGRSVHILGRIASEIRADTKTANEFPDFVEVPFATNVFTWVGDIWFDFGLLGVVGLALLSGYLVLSAHNRATSGDPRWIWISSALAAVLAATPLAFTLFQLSFGFMTLVGVAVFHASAPRRRGAATSHGRSPEQVSSVTCAQASGRRERTPRARRHA